MDSRRLLVATFGAEDDILRATRAARAAGIKIVDVFAPYAVHGLDDAMGLQPSRLPWVCLALGVFGAASKVWFEFWTTASDWPLNVGGKPWNSLPAFVPITFEVMVLFAGLSTVFAFLLVSGLRPWKKPRLAAPGVTDHEFALVLEETDSTFDRERVGALLAGFNATAIEERVEEMA
jgi:hypothetical protein